MKVVDDGAPSVQVSCSVFGAIAVAVPIVGAPGAVQKLMPLIAVAPVPPVSSQLDRRVLLVPPPVQETLKRPYMSERLSPVAPQAEAPPCSWPTN